MVKIKIFFFPIFLILHQIYPFQISSQTGIANLNILDLKIHKAKQAKQFKTILKSMCLSPGVRCDHYNNFTNEYTSFTDRYIFWITLRKCLKRTLEATNNTDFKSSEIEFFQPTIQHIRKNSYQWQQ